ncbi:hypothetical protein ACGFR8_31685 [Streptomyces brevispora]|uniref:hypothetical protein n=1 Tax=Streptomyces brevispora TaxID=887462 RepID=UPI0037220401
MPEIPDRCATCPYPPTRFISYDLSRGRVRRTEAFCDAHGAWLLAPGDAFRRPVVQLVGERL